MAVEMSLLPRHHKVNTVGGGDDEYKSSPAIEAMLSGRRTEHKMVPVWHPETGEKIIVTQFNARDMIRLDGYLDYDPKAPEQDEDEAAHQMEASTVGDYSAETSPHMKDLQALRDQLLRLGVKVDARWGLKRLKEEVAKFEVEPAKGYVVPEVPEPREQD
jgi:hypothetical protein